MIEHRNELRIVAVTQSIQLVIFDLGILVVMARWSAQVVEFINSCVGEAAVSNGCVMAVVGTTANAEPSEANTSVFEDVRCVDNIMLELLSFGVDRSLSSSSHVLEHVFLKFLSLGEFLGERGGELLECLPSSFLLFNNLLPVHFALILSFLSGAGNSCIPLFLEAGKVGLIPLDLILDVVVCLRKEYAVLLRTVWSSSGTTCTRRSVKIVGVVVVDFLEVLLQLSLSIDKRSLKLLLLFLEESLHFSQPLLHITLEILTVHFTRVQKHFSNPLLESFPVSNALLISIGVLSG